MLKFNLDKEIALRQNADLAAIVRLWAKDSNELKSESEAALESVSKIKELIEFFDKQETDYSMLVSKALSKVQKLKHSDHYSIADTSGPHLPNEEEEKDKSGILDHQVLLTIRYNDKTENYSLSKALSFIKEIEQKYEKQYYARQCYKKCVIILTALNDHNKMKISRWSPTEEATSNRSSLWNTRFMAEVPYHHIKVKPMAHQNDRNASDNSAHTRNIDRNATK